MANSTLLISQEESLIFTGNKVGKKNIITVIEKAELVRLQKIQERTFFPSYSMEPDIRTPVRR